MFSAPPAISIAYTNIVSKAYESIETSPKIPDTTMLELPSDEKIIAVCEQQRKDRNHNSRCFVYPSKAAPLAFIKYTDNAELRNHRHILGVIAQMTPEERLSLHIPQIYRCIEKGSMVYIVMEYIQGQTIYELLKDFPEGLLEDKFDQIFKAIRSLLSIPIPLNVVPGPVGGGTIKHPIFKDSTASVEYRSVVELQQHISKVANRMPRNNCVIKFSDDKLCLCFSDLYEGNFIFGENGDLYLIDFEGLSYLPSSFMTHALNQSHPVCEAIREKFELPTKNLDAMEAARYYFGISWRLIGLPHEEAEYQKIIQRRILRRKLT